MVGAKLDLSADCCIAEYIGVLLQSNMKVGEKVDYYKKELVGRCSLDMVERNNWVEAGKNNWGAVQMNMRDKVSPCSWGLGYIAAGRNSEALADQILEVDAVPVGPDNRDH